MKTVKTDKKKKDIKTLKERLEDVDKELKISRDNMLRLEGAYIILANMIEEDKV